MPLPCFCVRESHALLSASAPSGDTPLQARHLAGDPFCTHSFPLLCMYDPGFLVCVVSWMLLLSVGRYSCVLQDCLAILEGLPVPLLCVVNWYLLLSSVCFSCVLRARLVTLGTWPSTTIRNDSGLLSVNGMLLLSLGCCSYLLRARMRILEGGRRPPLVQ